MMSMGTLTLPKSDQTTTLTTTTTRVEAPKITMEASEATNLHMAPTAMHTAMVTITTMSTPIAALIATTTDMAAMTTMWRVTIQIHHAAGSKITLRGMWRMRGLTSLLLPPWWCHCLRSMVAMTRRGDMTWVRDTSCMCPPSRGAPNPHPLATVRMLQTYSQVTVWWTWPWRRSMHWRRIEGRGRGWWCYMPRGAASVRSPWNLCIFLKHFLVACIYM